MHIHVVYKPELFYFLESILNIPWRPLTAEVTPYIGTVEVSNIPINRKSHKLFNVILQYLFGL